MRHGRGYRKLGRTKEHRRALLRNLVTSLFRSESGRITTTVEKAKEARRMAERMITLGKREGVHARRLVGRIVADRSVIRHLFEDIAPKFAERKGGYTRVLHLGPRRGDGADMAFLELVGIAEDAMKAKKAKADAKGKEKKEKKPEEEDAEKAAARKAEADARREERKRTREQLRTAKVSERSKAKSAAKTQTKGGKKGG